MNQSLLSVRINTEDKKNFEKFCEETGMNISTAINMFIKTVIREGRLPFEIRTSGYELDDNYIYAKIREAEEHYNAGCKKYSSDEVLDSMRKHIM